MKVIPNADGMVLQLSQLEQQRVVALTKPMGITPRALLESYAGVLSANFLQDINDIASELENE